jgi:hypothetical protein
MDINGRVILNRYNGMREPGDYYDIIDMDSDDMADGTYVVRFNCGGVIKYRRIIKQ